MTQRGETRTMPLPDPPAEVRAANRRLLRHLGFGRVPDDVGGLPPGPVRAAGEVVDRALALHVLVAVTGGLEAGAAGRWLEALGAVGALTAGESDYLEDAADGLRVEDAARATAVESLAVLLWALGLHDSLPLEDPAPDAASVLPGPGEPVDRFLGSAALRPAVALVGAADLAAGMAWALRDDPDLEVGSAPGSLDPYVVRERHRAFRWLLGDDWA